MTITYYARPMEIIGTCALGDRPFEELPIWGIWRQELTADSFSDQLVATGIFLRDADKVIRHHLRISVLENEP